MFGISTKEAILSAAVALLGDHGLPKLAGPQVAKKARVRQSHVTYYFPRRSDLLKAVAQRFIESIAEEAFAMNERGESLTAMTAAAIGDRRRIRTLIGLYMAAEEDAALRAQLQASTLATRA